LRVAPASPGGLVVPGADVPIMSGQADSTAAPQLAPQGQVPDVAQLDQAAGLNQPPPPPPVTAAPAAPAGATVASAVPAPAGPAGVVPAGPQKFSGQVQLAATVDEGGAEAAWTAAQKKAPDVLVGKNPIILPAVINGQSVWRVRLSGFSSSADALAFCAQLTAKGTACTVAGS
jgi:SPOR domain